MLKIFTCLFFLFLTALQSQGQVRTTPTDSLKKPDKVQAAPPRTDTTFNAIAHLLAGMPIQEAGYKTLSVETAVKAHYTEFAKGWQNLETSRLNKIRTWQNAALAEWDTATYNLFYPFSGPDFLNAYELFPNADNYLLFGLERMGELPALKDLKGVYLQNYLTNIRQALSEIFQRNYFITSRMSGAFNSSVKGVLPILAVFLARTNHEIINIRKFYIQKDGKTLDDATKPKNQTLLTGWHIIFKNPKREVTQHLYYLGTDLADGAMANKPELVKWIKNFDHKATLIKSASYLLHTANFNTIRNLILEDSKTVLQDDTGVPYKYFVKAGWEVKLYGKYAPPIRDFNYGFQADLNQKFAADKSIEPLNFTFGYHWWTDKSSILYCRKE
jgi:hypothetical protein